MKQTQVSVKELNKFKLEHSWRYQMDNSRGADSWNNYSGDLEHPDWIVVIGRNRDSELISESNFEAALEMLGGESKHVEVNRFGHWGCGWFELIMVNPKSSKHVKLAYEIRKSLEDYPVLDDDNYYEHERQKIDNDLDYYGSDYAQAILAFIGVDKSVSLTKYRQKQINCIAHSVYNEDIGYMGIENAWVTKESILRWVKNAYEFKDYENTLIGKALKQAANK